MHKINKMQAEAGENKSESEWARYATCAASLSRVLPDYWQAEGIYGNTKNWLTASAILRMEN